MPHDAIDINAYFQRIAFNGKPTASKATLYDLHYAHTQAIPFENLDSFLGHRVSLALKDIQAKLVHQQRGGYCYEQNLLFAHVLEQLGFSVQRLAARVILQAELPLPPKTHMLLRVFVNEESYLVDVGFGGNTLTAPLLLENTAVQQTPHGDYQIIKKAGEYQLHTHTKSKNTLLYQFNPAVMLPIDYEPANYYMGSRPESPFCQGLMLARVNGDKRLSLRNRLFTVRDAGYSVLEQQTLESVDALFHVLSDEFHIQLPSRSALEESWYKLIA